MRRLSVLLLVLLVAMVWFATRPGGTRHASLLTTPTTPYTKTPLRLAGVVSRAVDGDTLHLTARGQDITVRLLGVDTPETHDPRKPVQCYGPEASAFVKQFTTGYRATVYTEPGSGDVRDRYGRILGYVLLRHVDLGATLLRRGYARVYAFDDRHFVRRAFYEKLQARAQARHVGRWNSKTNGGCA